MTGENPDRGSVWTAEMYSGGTFIRRGSQQATDIWSQQVRREKGSVIVSMF